MSEEPSYEALAEKVRRLEAALAGGRDARAADTGGKNDSGPGGEGRKGDGKRDVDALRAHLESVFRVAPTGIGVVVNRVMTQVNVRACEMTGYSREELLGQNSRMLYPTDEDYEYVGREKYVQIRARGTGTVETRWLRKDGGIIDVLMSSTPIDVDDLAAGVTFTALDITDRKKSERELLSAHRKLLDIVEFLPDPTFVVEGEGRIIAWNLALEGMTGTPKAEMLGKTGCAHAVPFYGRPTPMLLDRLGQTDEEIEAIYDNVAREGNRLRAETFIPLLNGGRGAHVVLTAARLYDAEGNITGAIQTIRDITHRKQAEKERIKLTSDLAAKNSELEQVVYVASHDLRSPLVNIDGYSRELEYSLDELRGELEEALGKGRSLPGIDEIMDGDIPEALRFIRAGTAKMDTLLSGLLRLSRSGRAALNLELLDMNSLVASVVESMEFQIREAKVTVTVDDLPPCCSDRVQVNQVFTNFLDNALKYTAPGRPGEIRVTGRARGDRSEYRVADNGVGIADAHQEKIFDIFHRLNPKEGTGEGLGLTIVKRIVGRLDGAVWVESGAGEGSRFHVALPANIAPGE